MLSTLFIIFNFFTLSRLHAQWGAWTPQSWVHGLHTPPAKPGTPGTSYELPNSHSINCWWNPYFIDEKPEAQRELRTHPSSHSRVNCQSWEADAGLSDFQSCALNHFIRLERWKLCSHAGRMCQCHRAEFWESCSVQEEHLLMTGGNLWVRQWVRRRLAGEDGSCQAGFCSSRWGRRYQWTSLRAVWIQTVSIQSLFRFSFLKGVCLP